MFVDRHVWRPVVEALAGQLQVVTMDLPGHGELAHQPFSLEAAVARLAELVSGLASPPAVVVGWSLGGYVAMELAARSPQTISGLVISGASVEPALFLRGPLRGGIEVLRRVPDSVSEPIARLAALLACPPRVARALAASGLYLQRGADALASLPVTGFEERLAAVDAPVLILNGRRDLLVRRTQERFLAACRHGSLTVLPRVGHLAPLQAPSTFASSVASFAEMVARGGTVRGRP